jgi:hypothetical protein
MEGHELPFYKFSSMSDGERKMTATSAISIEQ